MTKILHNTILQLHAYSQRLEGSFLLLFPLKMQVTMLLVVRNTSYYAYLEIIVRSYHHKGWVILHSEIESKAVSVD